MLLKKHKKYTILVCPNAFKESLSASEVAKTIHKGLKKGWKDINVIEFPIADGGNGTLDVLVSGTGGKLYKSKVTGPLGKPIYARYGILGDDKTAVIEMAEASGLELVPPSNRNPMNTTTYGTGELMNQVIKHKPDRLIIGIGGSATVDGGVGMAMALGVRFLDKNGKSIPLGAKGLDKIHRIDITGLNPGIKKIKTIIAGDVRNPLLGPKGAVRVFAPQKGATSSMLPLLESGMKNYARIIKAQLNKNIDKIPGGGAAGGMGAGLMAFCEAKVYSGIDIILDTLQFDTYLKKSNLVITGEGRLDKQTIHGKAPYGVAIRAKKYNVPVIAIAGSVTENAGILHQYGFNSILSIQKGPMTVEDSIYQARALIENTSEEIARLLKICFS